VTDYGDENPLHYDYYGFPRELYELKFKSHGDLNLANRIVDLYSKVGGPDPP
jgi:aromatic ring-opening dioxygenase catalytic subunit (LigB family)